MDFLLYAGLVFVAAYLILDAIWKERVIRLLRRHDRLFFEVAKEKLGGGHYVFRSEQFMDPR